MQSTEVDVGTRPAPRDGGGGLRLRVADHAGHRRCTVPVDTTRLTGVFGGTCVPAAGLCADTSPLPSCHEHAVVWLPTVRLAWSRSCPAAAGEMPDDARHLDRGLLARRPSA